MNKLKRLYCVECGNQVAEYTGIITGLITWFSVCSKCLYGVKPYTAKEIERIQNKRLKEEILKLKNENLEEGDACR